MKEIVDAYAYGMVKAIESMRSHPKRAGVKMHIEWVTHVTHDGFVTYERAEEPEEEEEQTMEEWVMDPHHR